ncbi:MAG: aspartate aminotransferase, partial [Oscillospiraceae bacterium]|nr:aspartate aminotransferase [Oscillospiraceae bacterium]
MKYDFTSIIDRRGMDALAVDHPPGKPRDGFDLIPMWVADMNFPTAPSIPEAIIERTKHSCYGYFLPRDEYYDAIINWQKERNGAEGLERKHIGYANG